mgnify:CR=1 FL=1
MTYFDFLSNLLGPLCIYDMESGPGYGELVAVGDALDKADLGCETVERECTVATAEDYGLECYEDLFPYKPIYSDLEGRRQAIMCLLQIREGSYTVDALNKTISGCGISARVSETDTKYTVKVVFPGTRGIPDKFEGIKRIVEQILPCHLDVIYDFVYLTWQELEKARFTWKFIEDNNMTWDILERYDIGSE